MAPFTIGYNVPQLQEVGVFEVRNCLPPLILIRSTKHYFTTEPPISCRCCYRLAFLSVVGYKHFYVVRLCHLSSAFLSGLCVGCFIFFEALEFFKNNFSFGLALQALLKTLVVCRLVRFLIVLANCVGYLSLSYFLRYVISHALHFLLD